MLIFPSFELTSNPDKEASLLHQSYHPFPYVVNIAMLLSKSGFATIADSQVVSWSDPSRFDFSLLVGTQLSFVIVVNVPGLYGSSTGSAEKSGKNFASDEPIPRTITLFGSGPRDDEAILLLKTLNSEHVARSESRRS